jgi:tetratricopeptide (TPR) repeat protein
MPKELSVDLIVVSRHEDPPSAPVIARALASAGLGVAEYQPAPPRDPGSAPTAGRQRVGTHVLTVLGTQASARVAAFRHDAPVTGDMGDAAFTTLTRGIDADDLRTLREGAVSLNLRVHATEAEVARALEWQLRALKALLDITQGACIDPVAQRCFGRAGLARLAPGDPASHFAVHDELWAGESRWLHTHGLQKFSRPELDLVAVPHALAGEAGAFLREVAARLAAGARLVAGSEVDLDELGTLTAVGAPVDVEHQAPFGRLRLVDTPAPGEREAVGATRLLARMALAEASQQIDRGDIAGALETIERVLAANPDDCDALALKARLSLRQGQPLEALSIGELMELRTPHDYRGAFVIGLALASLRRYREALHALNRAIDREPEAADAFAARAGVYERLGDAPRAAVDRAHAVYLGQ